MGVSVRVLRRPQCSPTVVRDTREDFRLLIVSVEDYGVRVAVHLRRVLPCAFLGARRKECVPRGGVLSFSIRHAFCV